jgi:hypothetical protein
MVDNVIRIQDYERRSKTPDAVSTRNPCDADVIAFPHSDFENAINAWDRNPVAKINARFYCGS